ncbi:formimidoylglutamase [Croceitalea sp. MTPC9]|uniref:formimidoylglutamase n=1 Tax=unclassified Croceitalea TaxID=2632280 RepID=UPI002B3BF62F|nr:formimidoylglutamase [Croceitalea sp. MTPC6]GMN17660.1 formimidoylglutamase [Croceitalea sp. MTPC9]
MSYQNPSQENWTGRVSDQELYLHEKVQLLSLSSIAEAKGKTFTLLGYACDEGVKRNQGRVGAKDGPNVIRKALAKMPNHLSNSEHLVDAGDVFCIGDKMEKTQELLAEKVSSLLQKNTFPILLGGGHDIAYGHYNGINKYLKSKNKNVKIGILNFDAHFDLRSNEKGNTSGTPFYQIAQENSGFNYLCLGIRKDANDTQLFETAKKYNADYVIRDEFSINHLRAIHKKLDAFMKRVDGIYVTIDLDGFSSAYAPGVSAASPMGFAPDIVLACLQKIFTSKKVVSMDLAEMNPKYDRDSQTAKLAASLIHQVIHLEF